MKIRTIRDRNTGRWHYSICFPDRVIVHNRLTNGSATPKQAVAKAEAEAESRKSLTNKQ